MLDSEEEYFLRYIDEYKEQWHIEFEKYYIEFEKEWQRVVHGPSEEWIEIEEYIRLREESEKFQQKEEAEVSCICKII